VRVYREVLPSHYRPHWFLRWPLAMGKTSSRHKGDNVFSLLDDFARRPWLFAHHVCHLFRTSLVLDLPIWLGDQPSGGTRAALIRGMRVGLPVQRLMGHDSAVVVVGMARALGRIVGVVKPHIKHPIARIGMIVASVPLVHERMPHHG
jgi:hypothetical protein